MKLPSLLLELFIANIISGCLKNFTDAPFFLDNVSMYIDRRIIVFCNVLISRLNY
jgi:hypothetical protein